ncbi:hypothetical protein EJB05_28578 [Eragrostis curvula]|uniref:Uncharacterized protein n=1 Tax=Eragrostis curvula TaxID=38414 RepID=A0A5J9UQB3_9POAL|nr:hypothetical protein EJB05_28578 [Eragrostis curvula]
MAFAFLAQLRFLFRFVPVKLEHHVHGASLLLTVRRRSHCRKSSRTTSYSCADNKSPHRALLRN